ncbi:MAG TPA: DUF2075 domain-containing protein [Dehalococcoidia bacterium]|nr:DUF2075 domain-containing protein [Dehalococcoidia bacterium]
MSNMYPSEFPKHPNPHDPEFEVFQYLRFLPANYKVYYSKKFKGGDFYREECELDFIVFDGDKSILCIEVKGGKIAYMGEQDRWTQNGKALEKSPERQASEAMHGMMKFLSEDIKDINVGWAVCFPNCSLPSSFAPPSGLPRDVIIDENALRDDVSQAIKKVESYYLSKHNRSGGAQLSIERIHRNLTRGIGFIESIGIRMEQARAQIIEVTKEQFDVLDDLEANNRMVVKGVAGSGKTLIATEYAMRLEAEYKSVLFLFYNRMLCNSVRRKFDRDSKVECNTFHSFARRIIGEVDPDWWKAQDKQAPDFWEDLVPFKLTEAVTGSQTRYDTIIVDEGQDFKPEWLDVSSEFLNDPKEGGFVVFYDDAQDLFKRWSDLPWGGEGVSRKSLTKNCRNTKLIVDFINDETGSEMKSAPRSPDGLSVIERVFENQSSSQEFVKKTLSEMLAQG